jgi:tetratricopeptide (TPR) repeat protein
MKRLALILLLCCLAIPFAWGDTNPIDDLYRQAQDAARASRWDDAIQFFERVMTEHAEHYDRYFDAEMNIAQMQARKGDFAAAAQSAHLCLDGAPNLQAFDGVVNFIASVLSAQDKSIDRANQFIAFEQSGTAGGRTNPMDAVGYPSLPAREAAFTTARQQAGDDAQASRLRAYTYLFTGKPRDALAQFSDAFRRNNNPWDLSNGGVELVIIGLRAVRGHRVGLDRDMQFVIYGPNGPDGIPKTTDDLADPFAPFLTVPPPGEGGLAGIDPDGLSMLRKVRDAGRLYAGDPLTQVDIRRNALAALERSTMALDGWGEPGQVEWYLRLALGLGCPAPDEYTTGYLSGLYYASRGRGNNYGGINAMWSQFDALCAAHNIVLPKQQQASRDGNRGQFNKNMTALAGIQFPPLNLQPLKVPAKF